MNKEKKISYLVLVRHGQSEWNAKNLFTGWKDPGLTPNGEKEAFEAGKLIMFDGANPHIGKAPQRACGELRCILAVQAIRQDAWQKHLDKMRSKS